MQCASQAYSKALQISPDHGGLSMIWDVEVIQNYYTPMLLHVQQRSLGTAPKEHTKAVLHDFLMIPTLRLENLR